MKLFSNIWLMDMSMMNTMWFYDSLLGLSLGLLVLVVSGIMLLFISSSISVMKNMLWLELGWTFIPSMIVMIMFVPSLQLLYSLESMGSSDLSLSVVGNSWYWSYSLDGFDVSFDSFSVLSNELNVGDFRMLDVDYSMVLPFNSWISLSVTSSDVIHSWSLPSMSIKLDCLPLQFSTMELINPFSGSFYGTCSELCGNNHSFMSINVEFVSMDMFINWLNTFE